VFAPVSYFSAALDSLMREGDLTQTALSKLSGVHQGQLSQYLRDDFRPTPDALKRLCQSFGSAGSRLAIAFLRDEIPEAYQGQIEVIDRGAPAEPSESKEYREFTGFNSELQQFLLDAARECERRPEVFRHFRDSLKLARGI
jgi:transcriptional regulator with XRE-family HTH domain